MSTNDHDDFLESINYYGDLAETFGQRLANARDNVLANFGNQVAAGRLDVGSTVIGLQSQFKRWLGQNGKNTSNMTAGDLSQFLQQAYGLNLELDGGAPSNQAEPADDELADSTTDNTQADQPAQAAAPAQPAQPAAPNSTSTGAVANLEHLHPEVVNTINDIDNLLAASTDTTAEITKWTKILIDFGKAHGDEPQITAALRELQAKHQNAPNASALKAFLGGSNPAPAPAAPAQPAQPASPSTTAPKPFVPLTPRPFVLPPRTDQPAAPRRFDANNLPPEPNQTESKKPKAKNALKEEVTSPDTKITMDYVGTILKRVATHMVNNGGSGGANPAAQSGSSSSPAGGQSSPSSAGTPAGSKQDAELQVVPGGHVAMMVDFPALTRNVNSKAHTDLGKIMAFFKQAKTDNMSIDDMANGFSKLFNGIHYQNLATVVILNQLFAGLPK
jgi:hypothetical protein